MTSGVTLCNRALQKLGQSLINSLEERSLQAHHCRITYESSRDGLLTLYPWPFALRRSTLSPLSSEDNIFPLPADCLRIVQVLGVESWSVEGRSIRLGSTALSVEVVYVSRVEDCNLMDALFQDLLVLRITLDLISVFTPSASARQLLEQEYHFKLQEARYSILLQSGRESAYDWFYTRFSGGFRGGGLGYDEY